MPLYPSLLITSVTLSRTSKLKDSFYYCTDSHERPSLTNVVPYSARLAKSTSPKLVKGSKVSFYGKNGAALY